MCGIMRLQIFLLAIKTKQILCANQEESQTKSFNTPLHFILQYNALLEILDENTKGSNFMEAFHSFLSDHQTTIKNACPTFLIRSFNISANKTTFPTSESDFKTPRNTIKWRFRHVIIISSEEMSFVSQALWLYGPNVSESALIFVRMSQKSFEAQNGTKTFKRDLVFGKMYPTLVLMTFSEAKYQLQIVCILCTNSLSPPPILLSKGKISSVHQALTAMNHKYNGQTAHGTLARLCQIGFRGNIFEKDDPEEGLSKEQHHINLEYTSKWRFDITADKDAIMLGNLMKQFNFTYELEHWTIQQGNFSGIYLNPGGDMPKQHIYGRQLAISYIISEFLIYCRKVTVIPATGWDFLWTPFDCAIWGFVFLTGVLFSALHKGQISYGLDVFWGVLGLPYTSDWSKNKFLSYFLLVLLNLNVGYLSVITSKVIIPNREEDISTPAELFSQGFRFIDENVTKNGENFLNYWGPYLDAAKVNRSIMSDILVNVDSCTNTHDAACISQWAGLATGVAYLHKKKQHLLMVPAAVRDRCHGVKQSFRSYWVSFYFQGPMASTLYKMHQSLIATGVDAFWDSLYYGGLMYEAYRKANHSESENGELPKLNFETPILVVFKAYGILITICIAMFPAEYLCFVFRRKRKISNPKVSNCSTNIFFE